MHSHLHHERKDEWASSNHTHAKILISARGRQCHDVTILLKLLIISVTLHTPQEKVSETLTHGTLNTINGVEIF